MRKVSPTWTHDDLMFNMTKGTRQLAIDLIGCYRLQLTDSNYARPVQRMSFDTKIEGKSPRRLAWCGASGAAE